MATEWELIHFGFLMPQVEDADLSIRDTSAEAGLWVQLVLPIPVTPGGETAHGDTRIFSGVPKGKSYNLILKSSFWQEYIVEDF